MATMRAELTVDLNSQIREALLSKAGEIYEQALRKVVPQMKRKADLIIKTAIDAYYDSYNPLVYDRTESLYKVYKIKGNEKAGFDILFDSRFIKVEHRVNNKYIYNVMFKKGYHGGAPHNGDYYWRWPSPQVGKELGIIPYFGWYPWGPASQSESPWERIQMEWNEYSNGEGKQLLMNAFKHEISKVIKEVS